MIIKNCRRCYNSYFLHESGKWEFAGCTVKGNNRQKYRLNCRNYKDE